jgi:hypothetical protein
MEWRGALVLSMANAALAFAVAEASVFAPVRAWLKEKSPWIGKLFSCGYCLGHWFAVALTLIYRPRLFFAWGPLDYILTVLVIAWFSAFQWAALCWLMERTGK